MQHKFSLVNVSALVEPIHPRTKSGMQ